MNQVPCTFRCWCWPGVDPYKKTNILGPVQSVLVPILKVLFAWQTLSPTQTELRLNCCIQPFSRILSKCFSWSLGLDNSPNVHHCPWPWHWCWPCPFSSRWHRATVKHNWCPTVIRTWPFVAWIARCFVAKLASVGLWVDASAAIHCSPGSAALACPCPSRIGPSHCPRRRMASKCNLFLVLSNVKAYGFKLPCFVPPTELLRWGEWKANRFHFDWSLPLLLTDYSITRHIIRVNHWCPSLLCPPRMVGHWWWLVMETNNSNRPRWLADNNNNHRSIRPTWNKHKTLNTLPYGKRIWVGWRNILCLMMLMRFALVFLVLLSSQWLGKWRTINNLFQLVLKQPFQSRLANWTTYFPTHWTHWFHSKFHSVFAEINFRFHKTLLDQSLTTFIVWFIIPRNTFEKRII